MTILGIILIMYLGAGFFKTAKLKRLMAKVNACRPIRQFTDDMPVYAPI